VHIAAGFAEAGLFPLVKRGLSANEDMQAFLRELARRQQSLLDETGVLSIPNEMAAHVLEELAKRFGDLEPNK
jgi:hypothetical protein